MGLNEYKVFFSGRVQGVGFRFTACHLARRFKDLTGYVRNLGDGRVEILAEASETSFKDYLRLIEGSPIVQGVTDTKIESNPLNQRQFNSFDIHV